MPARSRAQASVVSSVERAGRPLRQRPRWPPQTPPPPPPPPTPRAAGRVTTADESGTSVSEQAPDCAARRRGRAADVVVAQPVYSERERVCGTHTLWAGAKRQL